MKSKILTLFVALIALGASVNAQSVNVLTATGGYDQSVIYKLNYKLKPGDTAKLTTIWSDTSTMIPTYKIKTYAGLTDSFKTISDSVNNTNAISGITLKNNLVFQVMMTVKRVGLADTTIYSNQLRFSPKPTPTLFVTKASGPYVYAKGAITVFNIQSNTPIVVNQYASFSDSNKVFPAGSIYQYTIPAGSYLWNDTIKNLTTNSFTGFTFVGARKSVKLGTYIVTASQIGQKPSGFMKAPTYANGVLTIKSPTVTNLSQTWAKAFIRPSGATTWAQFAKTVTFLGGYGVDTATFSDVLAPGKYDLMITDSNKYGKYISNILPIDFSVPPQSCSLGNLSSVNTTSGTIVYDVSVSLQNGNWCDVYGKATQDTLSSVAQSPDEGSKHMTQSGTVRFTFTGLSSGWWFVKSFTYDKGNNEYHSLYMPVYVKFSADVKQIVAKSESVKVFPNPTNVTQGFTVEFPGDCYEVFLINTIGQRIPLDKITSGQRIAPDVAAGNYTLTLVTTSGEVLTQKLIFH